MCVELIKHQMCLHFIENNYQSEELKLQFIKCPLGTNRKGTNSHEAPKNKFTAKNN